MVGTMVPREELLEQRLDGLEKKVDDGFARADERFAQVEKKVDDGFKGIDERFRQVDKRFRQVDKKLDDGFEKVDKRFVSLERALMKAAVAVIVTLIGCCATLIGIAVL